MTKESDRNWVIDQIQAAKVSLPVGAAIVKLWDAWDGIDALPSPEQTDQALKLFSALAKGHAVAVTEDRWLPANSGFMIQVGQTVRVAPDAFTDVLAKVHNGRIGRVVGKRQGDIIVDSTDGKQPKLTSSRYPPNVLQIKAN